MTAPPDFRQHLEVETPEHVVLDFEIAGLGSRALAAMLDTFYLGLWSAALLIVLSLLAATGTWVKAAGSLLIFLSVWGYFTFFEGLRGGQTPGKRQMGIRVVRDTGHAVTFGAAAARNLLRVADFMPPPYLIGAVLVAVHPRGKRLGDLVAGTVVVRDRPTLSTPEPRTALAAELLGSGVPELTDEEFRLVHEFSERAAALPAEPRRRVAVQLTARLAERFPTRPPDPEVFLHELHRDELARRRGRFGARAAGASRGGVADRLAVRQSPRWAQFDALAVRAAQQGLDSFRAEELPDFAARYREVAADLARARTYRAPPALLARLERLVAAGHNALYRDERSSGRQVWRFVMEECPAAIITAHRTVLLAIVLFAAPATASYILLRERPALAEELLPQTMLDRAAAGADRQREGRGYFVAEAGDRGAMASQLMTNNITVAFNCFAGGIFAGVGSLLVLAYNGLALGAVSGHFANLGLLGYLWTFVIGHGILELFAVCVSGAAGFLLGRALIAPGEMSRADALVLSGRLALRLVGAVIVLLILAGLIEGFISAGTESLSYRLMVSATSLLFLILYLTNGALALRSGRVRQPNS
ncbi:MAG: stage II sporulation protein M [Gemmatimonadales bacterium]